jgi:K+-sensing histidine kinase KdpD
MKKKFKCRCNKPALVGGLFLGGLHLIWALLVAIIPNALQSFLNWIFNIHFIEPVWFLTAFNFTDAFLLTIFTFVMGYVGTLIAVCLWKMIKIKQ